ncbi:MAG: hypothetical protein WCO14_04910 [bacterium]
MDGNVGGYLRPCRKFPGFDALQMQGKARQDAVIFNQRFALS